MDVILVFWVDQELDMENGFCKYVPFESKIVVLAYNKFLIVERLTQKANSRIA